MGILSLLLIVASILSPTIYAGQVKVYDLQQNFVNSGLSTQFRIYFSLASGLGEYAYVRLVWPYDLGYTTTWTTSAGSWGKVSDNCHDPVDTFLIKLKRGPDLGIYSYNIWLTDENNTQAFSTLEANKKYMIFLQSASTAFVPFTTGYTTPIGFYTISNPNDLLYITYDRNPVFGYLFVTAPPGASMTSSVTSVDTNKQVIAYYNYPITVTLTPTVAIPDRFRIVFEMSNKIFDFVYNTCTYTSGGLTLTSLPVYSPGRVDFYFQTSLTTTAHTFKCGLKNPNYVSTGSLNIMTMYIDANHIVERNALVGSLGTVALNWGTTAVPNANLKLYLGWGISISGTSTTYPQPFRVFKSPSPTEFTYNTVKFGFKPQKDTPIGVEMILTMKTFDILQFVILRSTLVVDLPNAKGKTVSCTISNPASCTLATPCNVIVCTGVGPLSTYKEYSISFKFYILSTSGVTTVDTNFGTISATDVSANVILLAATPNIGSNLIQTNPTLIFTGIATPSHANFRAFQYVSSVLTNSPVNNPSSTQYGIQYYSSTTATRQDIVFEHTLDKTMVNAGTFALGDGVEIYASPSISLGGTLSCLSTGVTFATCQAKTVGSAKLTPALNFLLLRVGPIAANLATLFPGAAAKMMFRFQNMIVSQTSSVMFADDGVFDFYARGAAGVFLPLPLPDVTTTASTKNWLINTYVVQSGALANVNVGVSSFWTGTAANLDGTMFPAFIRLNGYFTTPEKAALQRISVFFNNLDFFVNSDGSVPCSSPVSTLVCVGKLGHNVANYNPFVMHRVDIDISTMKYGDAATNPFQIIIPVKTQINQMKITFGIAILNHYQYYFSNKGYFDSQYMVSVGEIDYTSLVNNPASLGLNLDAVGTYRITKPAPVLVGSTATTTLRNQQAIVHNGNTGVSPYLYASMVYCGSWAWNQDDSFDITPIPNVPSTSRCASVSYPSSVGTIYCTYCPIEQDLNNLSPTQKVTNYIFPYTSGPYMPNAYTVWSTYRGMVRLYGSEDTAAIIQQVRTDLTLVNPMPTHPSVLYTPSYNNRIYMLFTTLIGFPANAIVRIQSTSFGYSYGATATALFDGKSCTLNTFTAGVGYQCQLSNSVDYTSGFHNLTITGVDSIGAAQNYAYDLIIQTSTSQQIQRNSPGLRGAYTVVSGSLPMSIQNSVFSISNSQARTIFSFDFLPSKYTFSTEKYIFDLGGFAAGNSGNTVTCQVISGSTVSWLFQSCDISNLATVTLIPVREFWPNMTSNSGFLTLVISDGIVPTTAGTGITGTLQRGATIVQSAPSFPIPSIATANNLPGSCTIGKTYQADGSAAEFQLSITPTQSPIANPSYIYLKFPSYYSDGLSSKGVFSCTIDGDPVYCENTQSRWLVLRNFNQSYAINTAHPVKIYGIDTVVQSGGPKNIFIGIDNDNNPLSIQEQIELLDPMQSITTVANVGILDVYNIVIDTTEFRVASTFNITFTSPSGGVSAGKILTINFPEDYSNLLEVPEYKPLCTLTSAIAPTINLENACVPFGLRLKITLTAALSASTSYIIVIKQVRSPDTAYCRSNKLVLSILSSDESTVHYRSNPTNANANWISFKENKALKTLVWSQSSIATTLTLPIQLINGMYTQTVCLQPRSTKYSEDLSLTLHALYNANFSIDAVNGTSALTGAQSACFRLAPIVTTPATYYDIMFDRLEEFPTIDNYTAVPRLRVLVSSTVITISPQYTSYSVPFLGKSVPIVIDFSSYTPKNPITVEATINDTTKFRFASPSSQIVNTSWPIAYFFVKTTTTALVADTTTLTFNLTGVDTAAYNLAPASVTLAVVAKSSATTDTPTVALGSTRTAITQQLIFTTTQPATIYWGISFENTYNRPCEYIQEKALNITAFNYFDTAQEQFGFVAAPALAAMLTINNLLSNKDYTVNVCTELQNYVTTGPIMFNFTSLDNNIRIVKVEFTFDTALSVQQELDFACFLASEFLVFKTSVISQNRRSCQEKFSSIYIPPFYKALPRVYLPPPVNTSAYARRRVLNACSGDLESHLANPIEDGEHESEYEKRLLQSSTTSSDGTIFYLIYGNFRSLSDDSFYYLVEKKMNAFDSTALSRDPTFLSDIEIFLAGQIGFPSVITGIYKDQISSFTPGFQTFPAVTVLSGVRWLALASINLEDTGYVYGIADKTNQSTPNTVQIKYNLTNNNTNSSGFQLTFIPSGTQGVLNITGLENYTNYTLYYFSTSQDLGIYAVSSTVHYLNGTTAKEPPIDDLFATIPSVPLSLLIIIMMISFIY